MKLKLKAVLAWMSAAGAMALAAEDAYVEANGSQGINTGYRMTPDTRWEVDFQLTATTNLQGRIVGGDSADPNFFVSCYINSVGGFSFGVGDTFQSFWTGLAVDTARHTAILDCPAKTMCYINAAGVTNWTGTINVACTKTATVPLVLCATAYTSDVSRIVNASPVKITASKSMNRMCSHVTSDPACRRGCPGCAMR